MKILHVVSSLPTKDKPYDKPFVLSQIESLKKNGVQIDIMNLKGTENAFNYLLGIFRIMKLVYSNKYDAIHAHYSYCGWCSIFQMRMPVIVSLMGSDLFGTINRNGGQTFEGFCVIITTQLLTKLVRAVIVKSNRMRMHVRARHVFVVPNGIDFHKFKPASKERACMRSDGIKKVLFLGNPKDIRKNIALAKKSVALVKMANPKVELLSVFGVGQDQVVDLLNSSDVFLLTSFFEGSPNVVKEAMACNIPIVSTDVGDVREVIGDTEGCYITSYSPDDVAIKIEKALNYGKRTNGRDNIKHLEINKIAMKIISIYKEILSDK